MNTIQLKPCPFCGGNADHFFAGWSSRQRTGCTKCGIYTPPFATYKAAVKRWNRRAAQTLSHPDPVSAGVGAETATFRGSS